MEPTGNMESPLREVFWQKSGLQMYRDSIIVTGSKKQLHGIQSRLEHVVFYSDESAPWQHLLWIAVHSANANAMHRNYVWMWHFFIGWRMHTALITVINRTLPLFFQSLSLEERSQFIGATFGIHADHSKVNLTPPGNVRYPWRKGLFVTLIAWTTSVNFKHDSQWK